MSARVATAKANLVLFDGAPTSIKPSVVRESPVSPSHLAAPLLVHQIASEKGICVPDITAK